MTPNERRVFEKHLANKPVYLEYGCGGSTEIAVEMGCRFIVSIESDKSWVDQLSKKPAISSRIADKTLMLEHVDIGPVRDWGIPIDNSKLANWPNYFLTPYIKYPNDYKFILVDGRFRNCCAYAAYPFMSDESILAVHDYTLRPSYYDIEKFFDIDEEIDTLIILRKKKNILLKSLFISTLTNMFNY
ncbi:hypothetical protein MKK58_14780 [Methylobacterium sp. J-078]|uniref:hypothetical protein n=1 Tax=Methylobacterium sp. J-078 TaxID=2836657 RepID=UPI001FB8F15D|nr:hypothetical protein [Methylobacterium sp. J-078]MCJ2045784.1 hypothetical protein [Methylobacterium sp. J-078]